MPDSNFQDVMYGSGVMNNVAQDLDNVQTQVGDEDDNVTGREESIDNPQMRFEDSGGMSGSVSAMNRVQDIVPSAYISSSDYNPLIGNGGADQLTLSFRGEVYAFDSVSPDKVCFELGVHDLCKLSITYAIILLLAEDLYYLKLKYLI